jgi:hypothetical protein
MFFGVGWGFLVDDLKSNGGEHVDDDLNQDDRPTDLIVYAGQSQGNIRRTMQRELKCKVRAHI